MSRVGRCRMDIMSGSFRETVGEMTDSLAHILRAVLRGAFAVIPG